MKLTKPVTVYVPLWLPIEPPDVDQIPPPVTACALPGFERNVPDPVTLIMEPSTALAEAVPPGESRIFPASGPLATRESWMMSQRINAFPEPPAAPATNRVSSSATTPIAGAAAPTNLSLPRPTNLILLPISPSLRAIRDPALLDRPNNGTKRDLGPKPPRAASAATSKESVAPRIPLPHRGCNCYLPALSTPPNAESQAHMRYSASDTSAERSCHLCR